MQRRVLVPRELDPALLRCGRRGGRVVELAGETMGTDWRVRAVVAGDGTEASARDRLRAVVEGALQEVVRQMSHWSAESDLSRLRAAADDEWVNLPAELLFVLQRACELAEASAGAFDPTVGRLVALQGFGPTPAARWPGRAEFEAEKARGGWRRLEIDRPSGCARHGGARWIDLSAIAKGFAVDRVGDSLAAEGVGASLVEIGGECRGRGCKPDGQPWWVALEPLAATLSGGAGTVAALSGIALATSGIAAQRSCRGGVERSHLVEPRRARELDGDLLGVAVFADSCMDADGWATALFVLGVEAGLALAEARGLAVRFTARGGGLREVDSSAWLAMEAE